MNNVSPFRKSISVLALATAVGVIAAACSSGSTSRSALTTKPKSSARHAFTIAAPSTAYWNNVIAQAKKEGSVVIAGNSTVSPVDQQIATAFQKKYGIKAIEEPISGSFDARYQTELAAGKVTEDIRETGSGGCANWASKGDTQSFGQLPIMGEPPSTWLTDPFGALRQGLPGELFNQVLAWYLVENTRMYPGNSGPQSFKALANPAYKGKIIMNSIGPTAFGTEWATAAWVAKGYGPSYVKAVLANVKSIDASTTNAVTQVAEGNAGIYVMAFGDEVQSALSVPNSPIKIVTPSDGAMIAVGGECLMKGAPHPAAAKVFLNFEDTHAAQVAYADAPGGAFILAGLHAADPALAPTHLKLFPGFPQPLSFSEGNNSPFYRIGREVAALLPGYGLAS